MCKAKIIVALIVITLAFQVVLGVPTNPPTPAPTALIFPPPPQYVTQVPALTPDSRFWQVRIDTCNNTADATFDLNANYCPFTTNENNPNLLPMKARAFNLTNVSGLSGSSSFTINTQWSGANGTVWPYNTNTVLYLINAADGNVCDCNDLNENTNGGNFAVVVTSLNPDDSALVYVGLPGFYDGPKGQIRCGEVRIQFVLVDGPVCSP
jgi:hypothetical protein